MPAIGGMVENSLLLASSSSPLTIVLTRKGGYLFQTFPLTAACLTKSLPLPGFSAILPLSAGIRNELLLAANQLVEPACSVLPLILLQRDFSSKYLHAHQLLSVFLKIIWQKLPTVSRELPGALSLCQVHCGSIVPVADGKNGEALSPYAPH